MGKLSGITASDPTDEDFKKQLENTGMIFDLYAAHTDTTTGNSINITVENLKKTGNQGMSEEGYIDASIPQLKEQFGAQGFTVDKAEKGKITFIGKESVCGFVTVSKDGVTVHEVQVTVKKGVYMATVTFASYDEKTLDELVKMFSAA